MRQILINKMVLSALFISIFSPGSAFATGDVQAGKIKAYTCTGCHGIPGYNGMGGNLPPESVATLDRNTHTQ